MAGTVVVLAALTFVSDASASIDIAIQGTSSPSLPRQYAPGSTIRFVINGPAPSGTLQWYHNDLPISGATAAALTITNLATVDSGNYQLKSTSDRSQSLTVNVLPFPPNSVDTTFNAQIPSNLVAYQVFQGAADGSLIVQCYPTGSSPYANQFSVIRLNADGTRDNSVSLQLNLNSVLAVLPGGDLIMSQSPYRLHVDGTPGSFTLPPGFMSMQPLTHALVQPDGKILLAQYAALARLNADGTTDATFTPSTAPGYIRSLRLDQANRIVLGGKEPGPVSYGQGYVHRLLPSGLDDPAFQDAIIGSDADAYPLADGSIFVVDYIFSSEGPFRAKLKADGTIDPIWTDLGIFETLGVVVDVPNSRIFFVDRSGVLQRANLTATGMVLDPTFYAGEFAPSSSLQMTPDGKLLAGVIRLRADDVVSSLPPSIAIGGGLTPMRGSTVTLSARVTGTGPFTYQWLALDVQPLPADTTSANLVIPNFDVANLGRYQLRVTSPLGSVLSYIVEATYDAGRLPFLANLSGRAFVGTGDDTAIAGMAVKINAGALGITTLLRGAGPALQPYGVGGFLPNPVLNLYNAGGQLIGNNDTWGNTADLRDKAATVGAFPFAGNSNDAALVHTFGTSNSTLQLVDAGGASGVGLLEIYRVPYQYPIPGEILNLSLRARTAPGEKVATAGFVIADPQGFSRTARVLIRVVGPTLSQYGVAFPLTDPVLTLFRSDGTIVTQNNNWSDSADVAGLTATMNQVGAFALPSGSKDAAIVLDLPAGVYSVQATNAVGTPTTGVVLIEIYLVR